jgi:hypothetical protein
MHQPRPSIVVPERAGINPARRFFQAARRAPFAKRVTGMGNKNTVIRQAVENPELPIVIAN